VRQGQQNRRGRGRNRKSQNPLARSFESNGPDVKIRGTPAHIAEKYLSLARDAQSSGDPVLAENYLQHAEHYSRIIMAYREQLGQSGEFANGNGMRRPGEHGEPGDEFGDEEGEDLLDDGLQPPAMFQPQAQPHPRHQEARHSGHEGGGRHDRPFRRDRDQGRFRDRDRGERNDRDRGDRGDRERGDRDRGDRDRQGEGRQPFQERERAPERTPERTSEPVEAAGGGEPRRRDRFQQPHEQPDFLRRPVRRARTENGEAPSPPKDEPSRD
jgi:hypothetical protein